MNKQLLTIQKLKKKELEDIFENSKKENLDCIKKTYLKQNEF